MEPTQDAFIEMTSQEFYFFSGIVVIFLTNVQ